MRFLKIFATFLIFSPILAVFAASPQETTYLIDFKKVFTSSPLIYSFLSFLSVVAFTIWIYTLLIISKKDLAPNILSESLKTLLKSQKFDEAYLLCQTKPSFLSSMIAVGIQSRSFGPQIVFDQMKSEGKRISSPLWQKLSLLNDIAVVAPMIGLLGTVIGMFYAFYDVNRTTESINALFDGLGVAVGTTVFGLIVAILAMLFSTTLKYKLIKNMTQLESESLVLSSLIITSQR